MKKRTAKDRNALVPVERIETAILLIRGQKVMLDRDLAELYGVETRVLKQAVRRNIKRFPSDFMIELTRQENESLRSQNLTLKRGQHSKYLPLAFTEQGVAMLVGRSVAVCVRLWQKMGSLKLSLRPLRNSWHLLRSPGGFTPLNGGLPYVLQEPYGAQPEPHVSTQFSCPVFNWGDRF